jgi:hypothetical protein
MGMKNLYAKSLLLALVLLFGSAVVPAHADDFASSNLASNRVTWDIAGTYDRAVLTVSRPDGTVFRKEFKAGVTPAFDLADAAGNVAADGAYTWQIVLAPRLDARQKDALAAARRTNDPAAESRILAANGLNKSRIQSGTFSVAGGSTVPNDLQEPAGTRAPATPRAPEGGGVIGNDVVTADDAIIQGSLCVGLDCVNNESFGFDTIRLKENNTRIKFDDTSTGTGFPANDWQLTANDSASGGSSKFSIEDITGSKVPFTVTAGASTNSIFVDSTGRVGFRTSTPVLDLHVNTSNTPALRLEQNNSGGFTAQTWDIAGNEANFFVRDVTGGSRLPFRIRPGAPTSSIDINASGDVGIGTASPSNKLHVTSSASGATDGKVLISNTSGTSAGRELLEVNNANGDPALVYKNGSVSQRWSTGTLSGTTFIINEQAHANVELTLSDTGNLTVLGTVTPGSSREIKQAFDDIDSNKVLGRVLALPITTWAYKADPNVRHMGPMAEDFFSAFNLGPNDKGISVTDSAGVAFAAIQGLYHDVQQQNAELKARNAELEGRLANLEKMVQALAAKQN